MSDKAKIKRTYGWKPDVPDIRDYMFAAKRPLFLAQLPKKVDLSPGCSPVEDQGQLGSCTANAVVACLEFLEKKHNADTYVDLSRLYLYYYARLGSGMVNSDAGAYLREAIKAMAKRGTPHEASWPYVKSKVFEAPPAALGAEAKQHLIRDYQRLESLNEMKACLAMGYPFVFGFSVYESFESAEVTRTGVLNLPQSGEKMRGGHAVCAVGYDDTTRRLLVRNSWGDWWGQKGYFTMPYEFVTNDNLSADFWTIRR